MLSAVQTENTGPELILHGKEDLLRFGGVELHLFQQIYKRYGRGWLDNGMIVRRASIHIAAGIQGVIDQLIRVSIVGSADMLYLYGFEMIHLFDNLPVYFLQSRVFDLIFPIDLFDDQFAVTRYVQIRTVELAGVL